MFYKEMDTFLYEGKVSCLRENRSNLYLPLEVDTEYQTAKYPFTSEEDVLETLVTAQVRSIDHVEGRVYSFPGVPVSIPQFNHCSPIFDYIQDTGFQISVTGSKDSDEVLPILHIELIGIFLVVDLFKISQEV